MDEEEYQHLRGLRIDLVRRLHVLQQQQNKLDTMAPPALALQIEDTEREIQEIDEKLVAQSVTAVPAPSAELKQAIRSKYDSYMDFLIAQVMDFGQRITAIEHEVRESRAEIGVDRDERKGRQQVFDRKFSNIQRTLDRQDSTLAEQSEDIKAVRTRQRQIWRRLFWHTVVVAVLGVAVVFLAAGVYYLFFR